MKKYTIKINESKTSKELLFERMNVIGRDFQYPLVEQEDKDIYKNKLNESYGDIVYNKLVEHFSSHNKLVGKLNEDKKFLKNFSLLLEDDEFDPFAHLQLEDKIDEKTDCVLTFSKGNVKINHPYFSLPAGYTCPFAQICKSFVHKDRKEFKSSGRKIMDTGDIRCYAASAEVAYPNVQKSRWSNFELLQEFKGDSDGMANLIEHSLNYFGKTFDTFRIHESGDFYSQEYFDAWVKVARQNPEILFYAYTKALPYWVNRLGQISPNFKLNASKGGTQDELIDQHGLKSVTIVNDTEEAKQLGLPIDIDDTLAYRQDNDFALLLHGIQSKESGLTPQAKRNAQLMKDLKNRRK
jgi:hypothetical protein